MMIFLFLEPSLALLEAELPLFKVCLKIEKYPFTAFSTNCMKIKMLKTEMQGVDLFHKKITFYILHRESLKITHGMKNINTLVTSDQGKSGAMTQDTQYKIDF